MTLTLELTELAKNELSFSAINEAIKELALKYKRDVYEVSEEYNYICDCLGV